MEHLKYFENFTTTGNEYLVNKKTETLNNIETFVRYHKLSVMVIDIWHFGVKEFNKYTSEVTMDKMLYLKNDGCALEIQLSGYAILNIIKTKIEHKNGSFKPVIIFNDRFNFDIFKELMS